MCNCKSFTKPAKLRTPCSSLAVVAVAVRPWPVVALRAEQLRFRVGDSGFFSEGLGLVIGV